MSYSGRGRIDGYSKAANASRPGTCPERISLQADPPGSLALGCGSSPTSSVSGSPADFSMTPVCVPAASWPGARPNRVASTPSAAVMPSNSPMAVVLPPPLRPGNASSGPTWNCSRRRPAPSICPSAYARRPAAPVSCPVPACTALPRDGVGNVARPVAAAVGRVITCR